MHPAAPAPPRTTGRDAASGASAWRQERDGLRLRSRRRLAGVLLAAYAAAIGLVTLTPDSVDRGVYPALMHGVRILQLHGLPWLRYPMLEELANVALFVPLGMLGVLAVGARRWWAVALAGTGLSGAVELAQGAFLPARVASVSDVLANGTGAAAGAAAAALVAVVMRRRGRIRS